MSPLGQIRIAVQSFGAPFTVTVDGAEIRFSASGDATLGFATGPHVLSLRAKGTPGMPFEIELWSSGEDPWTKSLEFSPEGVIALSHRFSVGGTDWPGARA